MSDTPEIAAKKPIVVELEAGKNYFWCACGQSANQPWCDGSHKGTSFTPQKVAVEETKKYALCMCKQTQNPTFCDGTHANL